jgi:phage terminase large subunit-like protein
VDLDQASLAFNVAAQMLRNDPELAAIARSSRAGSESSTIRAAVLPGDSMRRAHGFNASAIIADELHAWPNRILMLMTSTGAAPAATRHYDRWL